METKVCSNPNCIHKGELQPLENFRLDKKNKRRGRCKDCEKEAARKHKHTERYRETDRRYQQSEKRKEWRRKYLQAKKEKRAIERQLKKAQEEALIPPGNKICSNSNCVHQGIPQPFEHFHKKTGGKNGLDAQCKDCQTKYYQAYVASEHGKAIIERYRNNPQVIEARKKYKKLKAKGRPPHLPDRWERMLARGRVSNAVRVGKLPHVSTQNCVYCGKQAIQYHHYLGYEREHTLDVLPVCRSCHSLIHKGLISLDY
jgi:aspartate carbamoyltransferase regulatory subunit